MGNSSGEQTQCTPVNAKIDPTMESKLIADVEMFPAASIGMLLHINGSQSRSIPTGLTGLTIGREKADVCIDDDRLSPEHSRIFSRDGAWYIEDLASMNGTYVDSVRVVSCLLFNGDLVQCGGQRFRFVTVSNPVGEDSRAMPLQRQSPSHD